MIFLRQRGRGSAADGHPGVLAGPADRCSGLDGPQLYFSVNLSHEIDILANDFLGTRWNKITD